MKKILYLVGLFLLSMLAGLGQTSIPTFQYVNVAPSGTCPGITPPIQIVYATGLAYSCQVGVWGPFAGTGASGATLPTDAIVYGLSPTTSRAAVAGADYISPTITNGMSQIGTAITGTNFNSNVFALYGDYCTGSPCAPAQDYYTFQNVVGTGVNPTTTLNVSHFGSSGASSAAFNFPVSLATGSTAVTQTTGDNTTKLATDAFVLANSGGGTPGGSTTQVQYNNSGVFAGDPTLTFDNGTKTLGFQNGAIPPLGTANSGTNYNSGTFGISGSYWNGTAAASDTWYWVDQVPSGTNPYTAFQLIHSGSSGGGQVELPFTKFDNNFLLNAQNGSAQIQFQGPPNMSAGSYTIQWPALAPTSGNTLLSCAPGNPDVCTWGAGGGSGGIAVTPQQFGGFGDAFSPPDGFNTTASSTTVTFTDGSLISTAVDGGKQVWIWGAGAAGVAFNSTIVTVTNSTTAVLAAAPSETLSNAHGVYGHDDTTAIQSCIKYSSVNATQCWLVPQVAPSGQNGITGYLVGTGSLQLTSNNALEQNSGPNLMGSSQSSGTNLFCEYNGDCLTLASGPIQGANVSNVDFEEDPTQPASRGMHFTPQVGTFGNGLLTNSNFMNVNVDNPALECLWLDGGGGPGYTYNLSNQYLNFYQFWCNGPPQSHPANLIKATGQDLQIVFLNGQVNGQAWNGTDAPNYANPLINLTEKTTGLGDSPSTISFYGFTTEVGTQGMYIGNGTNSIHYDNGYWEDVSTPFIVTGSAADTFDGNHFANSGNITSVYQFASNTSASVRDSLIYGGVAPSAALAICTTPPNQIIFDNNNIGSGSAATTNCATSTESTGGGSITIAGTTSSITATGSFNTIYATGVSPGKTLTVYNAGSSVQLTSGGNIAFGNYTAPLTIPAGGSVTLTLLDAGVTWLVTDGPPPTLGSPNWSTIVHGANTDTGAFSTQGAWSFHQGGVYYDSSTGSVPIQFGPGSTCSGNCGNIYDDGNLHIDRTANGNGGLFFKGNFSGSYIAAFGPDTATSATNTLHIGLDGSYLVQSTTGHLQLGSARKGTFSCTAGGTITIANANEQNASDVVISLNGLSGTISTPPAMSTVTAGTGFTVLCGVADTSTYNYDILN